MDSVETYIRLRYGEATDPGYIDRIPKNIAASAYCFVVYDKLGYHSTKSEDEIIEQLRKFFKYWDSYPESVEVYAKAINHELIKYHQNGRY